MASKGINRVVLLGHLGNDAETKFNADGVARTTFSLATNRIWKDRNGDQKEDAEWHNVVLWRSENLATYLTKGKQVYLEGRLATRSYEKDDERRYVTEVVAEDVILLGGGGSATKDGNPSTPSPPSSRPESSGRGTPSARSRTSQPAASEVSDDVPFDRRTRRR